MGTPQPQPASRRSHGTPGRLRPARLCSGGCSLASQPAPRLPRTRLSLIAWQSKPGPSQAWPGSERLCPPHPHPQMAQYFCSGVLQDQEQFRHYALNVPLYTHFTSPIRRFADIMVHRLLAAALGKAPRWGAVRACAQRVGARQPGPHCCGCGGPQGRAARTAGSPGPNLSRMPREAALGLMTSPGEGWGPPLSALAPGSRRPWPCTVPGPGHRAVHHPAPASGPPPCSPQGTRSRPAWSPTPCRSRPTTATTGAWRPSACRSSAPASSSPSWSR